MAAVLLSLHLWLHRPSHIANVSGSVAFVSYLSNLIDTYFMFNFIFYYEGEICPGVPANSKQ